MSFKHIVILLISIGLVVGCGSVTKNTESGKFPHYRSKSATPGSLAKSDANAVKNRLYKRYREWRGVRYRLGGSSRSGIDCSGLVQIIYRLEFGLALPRVTLSQARLGNEIGLRELRPGDLVFFKTGKQTRHVGIYLEDKKFFHASTTKGVTLSRLDNSYWKTRYWKSVRL